MFLAYKFILLRHHSQAQGSALYQETHFTLVGDVWNDITVPYYYQLHSELYACVCSHPQLLLTIYTRSIS